MIRNVHFLISFFTNDKRTFWLEYNAVQKVKFEANSIKLERQQLNAEMVQQIQIIFTHDTNNDRKSKLNWHECFQD